MSRLICLVFLVTFSSGFSQVVKDTSYTITSEYSKQFKKFPFIKVVQLMTDSLVLEEKDIIYHSLGNRNLYLDSYSLKSTSKLPAIILLHGGGWKSGNKSMLRPLAQKLALSGYQCFTIEYRLSDEAIYPAAIEDVVNAIEFIKINEVRFNIESNKIAILGCSSGGQMAALIGTKYGATIQAVINIDGILAFHHPQSQEGKLASLWLGGTYEEKPEIWSEASALTHVSNKTPPTLFINSQFERFHAGRDEMIAKLKGFGIYNKVETIENSPHTFWLFHPWFETTIKYVTSFLEEQLKS